MPIDLFFGDLMEAASESGMERHIGLVAAKLDLSKAFDRIPAKQCVRALRRRGLHYGLAKLLVQYYDSRQLFFVCEGYAANGVCKPVNGIPQGCPFAPLLMNVAMAEWLVRVVDCRDHAADTRLQAFLDDRLIYVKYGGDGISVEQACGQLQKVLDETK